MFIHVFIGPVLYDSRVASAIESVLTVYSLLSVSAATATAPRVKGGPAPLLQLTFESAPVRAGT